MGEGILKKKKIGIERQVGEFLDRVSEAGLLCRGGMDAYLRNELEVFATTLESIRDTEHHGDGLRRTIELELYRKTLIPESRGDVMELLEDMDALLDRFTGLIWQFEIERPEICPEFHADFKELLQHSIEAVEAMVRSCRSFFTEITPRS